MGCGPFRQSETMNLGVVTDVDGKAGMEEKHPNGRGVSMPRP
jgi:hypothetical protein